MGIHIDLPLTEFERVLRRLEGLTRGEIAELVTAQIVDKDAESFAGLTEGLSIETLRFLSARALAAAHSHRRPTLTWLTPGLQIRREGRRGVPGGEEPTDRRRAAGARAFHDGPAPIAHMRLRTATAVPALPEAPGWPSMPVIRIPGE
jgi:hypothetical protein